MSAPKLNDHVPDGICSDYGLSKHGPEYQWCRANVRNDADMKAHVWQHIQMAEQTTGYKNGGELTAFAHSLANPGDDTDLRWWLSWANTQTTGTSDQKPLQGAGVADAYTYAKHADPTWAAALNKSFMDEKAAVFQGSNKTGTWQGPKHWLYMPETGKPSGYNESGISAIKGQAERYSNYVPNPSPSANAYEAPAEPTTSVSGPGAAPDKDSLFTTVSGGLEQGAWIVGGLGIIAVGLWISL